MSRLLIGNALALLLTLPAPAQDKKGPAIEKEIGELITKLGDARFEVRRDAYKALVQTGRPALPQLRRAAENAELEIRMRARGAIKEIEARPAGGG